MLSLLGIVDMLIGSNIVPVEKKGTKKLRVCIDFRDFNKATPKDEYPMPIADFLVNSASGH
jgi:xanthosine utilization system XapX-like protein